MATQVYGNDLTTIVSADAAAAYAEATATGWTDAGTPTQPDTDVFIQGTGSASYPLKTGVGAALANAGSPVTIVTDGAYLLWQYHAAPNTLATEANGGMRIIAGDSLSAFIGWSMGGSDTYTYGGWQCLACNPSLSKDWTAGAPTEDGVYQYIGLAYNQTGTVNRGNPMVMDALRYGRCELRVAGGDGTYGYCTFLRLGNYNDANAFTNAGVAYFTGDTHSNTTIDNISIGTSRFYIGQPIAGADLPGGTTIANITSSTAITISQAATGTHASHQLTSAPYNRLGLFQLIAGGYLWKGLLTLGYSSAVDFRDSNRQIIVEGVKKVTANFNKIEIRQASSRVDWTNISILSLSTVSRGRLEVVDDCDVNFASCTFTDMDTFIFKVSSAVLNSTFRRCGQITANGADFSGTVFEGYEGSADSSYVVWDVNTNPNDYFVGCSFTKGTAATHAITLGTTSPTSVAFNNVAFSGYNASNDQTDSTIYVARTGGTVTITINNCSGNISYKSAGATVTFVYNTVSLTQYVRDINTNALISGARVRLMKVSDNSVVLEGETGVGGYVNEPSYQYTSPEAVYGWCRKATASPLYKEGALSGNITAAGYEATVLLIPDE